MESNGDVPRFGEDGLRLLEQAMRNRSGELTDKAPSTRVERNKVRDPAETALTLSPPVRKEPSMAPGRDDLAIRNLLLKPDSDVWHESEDRETDAYGRRKLARIRREGRKSKPKM